VGKPGTTKKYLLDVSSKPVGVGIFCGAAIAIVKIIGGRDKILLLESILIDIFDVFVRIYTVPSNFLVDINDKTKQTPLLLGVNKVNRAFKFQLQNVPHGP
jgi:hypothetical protein